MTDIENHMVLPVADDQMDGPPERCECYDCGAVFDKDQRVPRFVCPYVWEDTCPECGSTELGEHRERGDLRDSLYEIAESQSLKTLWDQEK